MFSQIIRQSRGIEDLDVLSTLLVILTAKYVFISQPALKSFASNFECYQFLFPSEPSPAMGLLSQDVILMARFYNPAEAQKYHDVPSLLIPEFRQCIVTIRQHYCAVRHRFIEKRPHYDASLLPPLPFFSDIDFISSILIHRGRPMAPIVCPTRPICDRVLCPYNRLTHHEHSDPFELEGVKYVSCTDIEDVVPTPSGSACSLPMLSPRRFAPSSLSPHVKALPPPPPSQMLSQLLDSRKIARSLRSVTDVKQDELSLSMDGKLISPYKCSMDLTSLASIKLPSIPRNSGERGGSEARTRKDSEVSSFSSFDKPLMSTSLDGLYKASVDRAQKDSFVSPPSPQHKVEPIEISSPLVPLSSWKRNMLVQTPGAMNAVRLKTDMQHLHRTHLQCSSMPKIASIFNSSELPLEQVTRFIGEIFALSKLRDLFSCSLQFPENWVSIKRVIQPTSPPDTESDDLDDESSYIYKCMYSLSRRLFYLLILDLTRPSAEQCGASKEVTVNNFFFVINGALPLWRYFVSCDGDFRVSRGWRVAAMAPTSPAFARLDGSRTQLIALVRELVGDNFVACPIGDSAEMTFIAPFLGANLSEMRRENNELTKQPLFLMDLVFFILRSIEENCTRYDLKPHNILYNSDVPPGTCPFSWIDYTQVKTTFVFLLPGVSKIDLSGLCDVEQKFVIGCLRPLANCLVNTVRYLMSSDPEIFSDSAIAATVEFWQQYWRIEGLEFRCGLHSRLSIFYSFLKESIDILSEMQRVAVLRLEQRQSSPPSSSSSSSAHPECHIDRRYFPPT